MLCFVCICTCWKNASDLVLFSQRCSSFFLATMDFSLYTAYTALLFYLIPCFRFSSITAAYYTIIYTLSLLPHTTSTRISFKQIFIWQISIFDDVLLTFAQLGFVCTVDLVLKVLHKSLCQQNPNDDSKNCERFDSCCSWNLDVSSPWSYYIQYWLCCIPTATPKSPFIALRIIGTSMKAEMSQFENFTHHFLAAWEFLRSKSFLFVPLLLFAYPTFKCGDFFVVSEIEKLFEKN